MNIQRKSLPESIMLESSARVTLAGIPGYAETVIPRLLAQAESRGLTITGPCVFTYEGCTGDPGTEFTLRIGFPVDREIGGGEYVVRRVPAHDCLSTSYQGPMAGIGEAWSRFTPAALTRGLVLQPVGREVYLQWIDQDSRENLVELQILVAG